MANYQPNYVYSPLYGNRYMGGSRTPAPSTGGAGQVDTSAIQSRNTAVGVPYTPVVEEQQPLGPIGFSSTGRDQSAVESLSNFGFRANPNMLVDPFEGTDYLSGGFGSPSPINTTYVQSVPESIPTPSVSFDGGGGDGPSDNSSYQNLMSTQDATYSALGSVNPAFKEQYDAYQNKSLFDKVVGGVIGEMYDQANLKQAYNEAALEAGQVMYDPDLIQQYVFGVDPIPDSYSNVATAQDVVSARSDLANQGANVSTGSVFDTTQGVYDETDYLDGGVKSYNQNFTQTTQELDADALDSGNTGFTTTRDQNKLAADQEAQDQTGNPNASAVTNSQGEAVRSSDNSVVTSGNTSSGGDNSGGK